MSVLKREMGFTQLEFMRLLPAALREHSYHVDGQTIHVEVEGKPLVIRLGAEQVRRIALLTLPYIPVEFDYHALEEDTFKRFLQRFDLYYRKGGG